MAWAPSNDLASWRVDVVDAAEHQVPIGLIARPDLGLVAREIDPCDAVP